MTGLRTQFGLNKNRNRHGAGAIGGMSGPYSTHVQGRPPQEFPKSGQTGMPNQAASVQASRLMQNTSTEEDAEYWMGDPDDPDDVGATFDPPYDIRRHFSDYGNPDDQIYGENMENLVELFGFKRVNPAKILQKAQILKKNIIKTIDNALTKARIHKIYIEKTIAANKKMSVYAKQRAEKNEDLALDAWKSLDDKINDGLEMLETYAEDLQASSDYEMLLRLFNNFKIKSDNILTNIRAATAMAGITKESVLRTTIRSLIEAEQMGEFEEFNDEEMEEVSSVGGGAVRGHIGPLGSDNQSPYLKKKKKKKKHYEPTMKAFADSIEVD